MNLLPVKADVQPLIHHNGQEEADAGASAILLPEVGLKASQAQNRTAKAGSAKALSERRCMICGQTKDAAKMLRFAVAPAFSASKTLPPSETSTIVFDVQNKLPGRGVWLCAEAICVEKAAKPFSFAKATRQKIDQPNDLSQLVSLSLRKQIIQLIALCRRAGIAVAGAEKARGFVAKHPQAWLLVASDAAAETRHQIAKHYPPEQLFWQFALLDGASLAQAFAKERVAQIAIAHRYGLVKSLMKDLQRLHDVTPQTLPTTLSS